MYTADVRTCHCFDEQQDFFFCRSGKLDLSGFNQVNRRPRSS